MTQKQIFGVIVGVALVIVVGTVVYRQYTGDTAMNTGNTTSQKKMGTEKKATPVPDTVDGVVGSIESETVVDTEAMNEEEAGTLGEVDVDSESVNNLGTSYDENSL